MGHGVRFKENQGQLCHGPKLSREPGSSGVGVGGGISKEPSSGESTFKRTRVKWVSEIGFEEDQRGQRSLLLQNLGQVRTWNKWVGAVGFQKNFFKVGHVISLKEP